MCRYVCKHACSMCCTPAQKNPGDPEAGQKMRRFHRDPPVAQPDPVSACPRFCPEMMVEHVCNQCLVFALSSRSQTRHLLQKHSTIISGNSRFRPGHPEPNANRFSPDEPRTANARFKPVAERPPHETCSLGCEPTKAAVATPQVNRRC